MKDLHGFVPAPINFQLGGGEDGVWLSTSVLDAFGGREAALKDFGGYLQRFSRFLDEHLETARLVEFDDELKHDTPQGVCYRRDDSSRTKVRKVGYHGKVMDPSDPLIYDVSLSCAEVGAKLGVSGSVIQRHRKRLGVVGQKKAGTRGGGGVRVADWAGVLAANPDTPTRVLAEKLGVTPSAVIQARRKHRTPQPPPRTGPPPAIALVLERMDEIEGMSSRQAEAQLGVSYKTIQKARKLRESCE